MDGSRRVAAVLRGIMTEHAPRAIERTCERWLAACRGRVAALHDKLAGMLGGGPLRCELSVRFASGRVFGSMTEFDV